MKNETRHRQGFYEKYIKRVLDFIFSLVSLILLSPVLLVIAILVRIKLGSPVMFTQERPGLNAKIFKIYKFRTMTDEVDEMGELLPDTSRLTSFGEWLRASSLDELPELFNILKGDMSFVGPRPLLVRYLPRYSDFEKRRHEVRPGLTGYAQVHGRNLISWDEKFKWDVKYVDEVSFLNDFRVIMRTVFYVLRHEGINASNDSTMPEFTGDKEK